MNQIKVLHEISGSPNPLNHILLLHKGLFIKYDDKFWSEPFFLSGLNFEMVGSKIKWWNCTTSTTYNEQLFAKIYLQIL